MPHGLLREILSPYEIDSEPRYDVVGEDVPVGDRSATPIALVIHELATNAIKYGALSSAGGRVHIETRLEGEDVTISWHELGGLPITGAPTHTGFGTQLSEISIADQLGGTIDRIWENEGLKVAMRIRVAHL